jgi:hypothetical protein
MNALKVGERVVSPGPGGNTWGTVTKIKDNKVFVKWDGLNIESYPLGNHGLIRAKGKR